MADRDSTVSLFTAFARIDDPAALSRLLEPVPDAGSVRQSVTSGTPGFGQVWHDETSRDYWIAWSAETVACFTIAGLTLEQAARVRIRFDELDHSSTGLDARLLAGLMSDELGATVSLVD